MEPESKKEEHTKRRRRRKLLHLGHSRSGMRGERVSRCFGGVEGNPVLFACATDLVKIYIAEGKLSLEMVQQQCLQPRHATRTVR